MYSFQIRNLLVWLVKRKIIIILKFHKTLLFACLSPHYRVKDQRRSKKSSKNEWYGEGCKKVFTDS